MPNTQQDHGTSPKGSRRSPRNAGPRSPAATTATTGGIPGKGTKRSSSPGGGGGGVEGDGAGGTLTAALLEGEQGTSCAGQWAPGTGLAKAGRGGGAAQLPYSLGEARQFRITDFPAGVSHDSLSLLGVSGSSCDLSLK